jgi:hypothetical protein
MRSLRFLSIAAAATIAVAAPARAMTLRTAPASDTFAKAQILCEMVNTGTTPIHLKIEARSYDGTLIDSVGPFPLTGGNSGSYAPYDPGAAYCKFIVLQGSAKKLRAQAVYADPATGNRMIAVPAR